MRRLGLCLRLFGVLLSISVFAGAAGLSARPAEANAGPPRYRGDAGGPLLPGESDQVHVLAEHLSFELDEDLGTAAVTARYRLENRGEALPAQPFVFVVQGVSGAEDLGLTAVWEGEALQVEEVDLSGYTPEEIDAMRQAWTTAEILLDPVTGEPYEAEHFGGEVLRYFTFDVPMPAGGAGDLVVRYRARGAFDRSRYTHKVYNYQYLLLPARGWASFGPLEIEVRAPAGERYYFTANLPFQFEEGAYRARLDTLPEENLTFAVMSRKGILFGWLQPGPYLWMAFAIVMLLAVVVGLALGWLAGRIPSRLWAGWVAFLGGLALGGLCYFYLAMGVIRLFPTLRSQHYAGALAALGFAVVGAVVTAASASGSALRTWRVRNAGRVGGRAGD